MPNSANARRASISAMRRVPRRDVSIVQARQAARRRVG
jgi:hypothetical protein